MLNKGRRRREYVIEIAKRTTKEDIKNGAESLLVSLSLQYYNGDL